MKFSNAVAALTLTIVGLSQASPIEPRKALQNFQLKTKVIKSTHKDCGTNKDGLYIASYHTGAGEGIAAGFNQSLDSYFYINGTGALLWTYPENDIGAWPTELEYGPYQSYNPFQISIATVMEATTGFSLSSNNVLNLTGATGFIMCDDWYASPQLFALAGYEGALLPSSCSNVELHAVPTIKPTATATATATA